MIATIKPIVFYGITTLITAIYWFSLQEFARLPSGVHHKFVAGMFVPYLLVVALLSNWYEQQRAKAKAKNTTNARSEPPKE